MRALLLAAACGAALGVEASGEPVYTPPVARVHVLAGVAAPGTTGQISALRFTDQAFSQAVNGSNQVLFAGSWSDGEGGVVRPGVWSILDGTIRWAGLAQDVSTASVTVGVATIGPGGEQVLWPELSSSIFLSNTGLLYASRGGGSVRVMMSPTEPLVGEPGAQIRAVDPVAGVDERGEVTAIAYVSSTTYGPAIVRGRPGAVKLVVPPGTLIPGTNVTIAHVLGGPALGERMAGSSTSDVFRSGSGLVWEWDGARLRVVVRQEDPVPGSDGSWFQFGRVVLAPAGVIGFTATLNDGRSGVWLSGPGGLRKVALVGDPMPGSRDPISWIDGWKVNGRGEALVWTKSSIYGPRELWFQRADGQVRIVAQAGGSVPLYDGQVGTISFAYSGGLNERGQVVAVLTVGNTSGLWSWNERDGLVPLAISETRLNAPGMEFPTHRATSFVTGMTPEDTRRFRPGSGLSDSGRLFYPFSAGGRQGLASVLIPGTCLADVDFDGAVTGRDVLKFLSDYFAGFSRADIDGAAGLSAGDVFEYVRLFGAGC